MNEHGQNSTNSSGCCSNLSGTTPCCPTASIVHGFAHAIARAKSFFVAPAEAWTKVAEEQDSVASIYRSYLIYLMALPAIGGLVGLCIVGVSLPALGTWRAPFFGTLISQLVTYLLSLAGIYLGALIVEKIASRFEGTASTVSALKLCAYSGTPIFVAGIAMIMPWLGALLMFPALAYGIYLLWIGIPVVLKVPAHRRSGFVAVCAITMIVVGFVIGQVSSRFTPQPKVSTEELERLEDGMKKLHEVIEKSLK